MANISRFEDIEAWKKARQLNKAIYTTSSKGKFAHDFSLRDQIRRASISVMSNIAEGFERGGDKEFRQFLAVAKGSTGEVRSQLYAALDVGFLEEPEFLELYNMSNELSRLIAGFMRYLGDSDYKGNKFREAPGPEYETPTSGEQNC
jgi:four helix bundle protein